jgi:hypothetical protein
MKNKITLPDNFEIDKIENGVIYLKEKYKIFPKTWEECVYYNLGNYEGINDHSKIVNVQAVSFSPISHNIIPKGLAKPILALSQLLVCRNAYWKIDNNWNPKISRNDVVYVIYTNNVGVITRDYQYCVNFLRSSILSFRTPEIRDKFYDNFKDLIEQAKELL